MRLLDYRNDLLIQLKDRKFAANYLKETLDSGDFSAFSIALKDVLDAHGGVAAISAKAKYSRASIYRALRHTEKLTIGSVQPILKALGMRLAIKPTNEPKQ